MQFFSVDHELRRGRSELEGRLWKALWKNMKSKQEFKKEQGRERSLLVESKSNKSHSILYLFNKSLLSDYYVPSIILVTEDRDKV